MAMLAQISGGVDTVLGGGGGGAGAAAGNALADTLINQSALLIPVVTLFMLVRAGIMLINSQEESKFETAKKSIGETIVGTMLAYISQRLVIAFYNASGPLNAGQSGVLITEVLGIMSWVRTLAAVAAVGIIVASAARAISRFGDGEGTEEIKKAVTGVVAGLILLTSQGAILLAVGLQNGTGLPPPVGAGPEPIIARGYVIVQDLLFLLIPVATVLLVYAGILLTVNFGNDDQVSKAKGLFTRVGIGLAVILTSYVLWTLFGNLFGL